MLFLFVCIYWCPTHIVLCFCFVYLRLVYPVISFSGLSIVVCLSVFSNVYLYKVQWPKEKDQNNNDGRQNTTQTARDWETLTTLKRRGERNNKYNFTVNCPHCLCKEHHYNYNLIYYEIAPNIFILIQIKY